MSHNILLRAPSAHLEFTRARALQAQNQPKSLKEWKMTKRNDLMILQGYQDYITGATDSDLAATGLNAAEIHFVKEFHKKATSGVFLGSIIRSYPPKSRARELSREMFHVYEHPDMKFEARKPNAKTANDREISFIAAFGFEEYKMRGHGI